MSISASSTTNHPVLDKAKDGNNGDDNNTRELRIIFSDVDGTLVHYPTKDDATKTSDKNLSDKDNDDILYLPPSKTGMRGVISKITISLCNELRKKHGIKLILVSGMRTTTLMERIPYLPEADAYCSENGGRIFISREEDLEWRRMMSSIDRCGEDGYDDSIPIQNRRGKLWEFATKLQNEGWIIDCRGYATCFRCRFENQKSSISLEQFQKLSQSTNEVSGIVSSYNLGCIDFYPSCSGKKNCCQYLAKKILIRNEGNENMYRQFTDEALLKKFCVCLCDDDNDLDMALSCGHAYIPSITSQSMKETIAQHEQQFTIACNTDHKHDDAVEATKATNHALSTILDQVNGKYY